MLRDEFSEEVKRILSDRVGNRCSNPQCRQPTSGPRDDPTKAVNIGVAAHITAASAGGPRYDANISAEQRRSTGNGIWLCQNCVHLADTDPVHYPVELLRRWKEEAEASARVEVESGAQRARAPEVNAAVMIQGPNAINISGPNAVNIAPGGIRILGPIVRRD